MAVLRGRSPAAPLRRVSRLSRALRTGAGCGDPSCHRLGSRGCFGSAIGGIFYTGTALPVRYRGAYFFADYVRGWIRYVNVDGDGRIVGRPVDFVVTQGGPVDIEIAPDGSLLYLSIIKGAMHRIRYTG